VEIHVEGERLELMLVVVEVVDVEVVVEVLVEVLVLVDPMAEAICVEPAESKMSKCVPK